MLFRSVPRLVVPLSELEETTRQFERPFRAGTFPCRVSHRRIPLAHIGWMQHVEVVLTDDAVGIQVRRTCELTFSVGALELMGVHLVWCGDLQLDFTPDEHLEEGRDSRDGGFLLALA